MGTEDGLYGDIRGASYQKESGINLIVGPSGSTTRDRCVDTQQGGARGVASAGIGARVGSNLQCIVSSEDRGFAKDPVHLLSSYA